MDSTVGRLSEFLGKSKSIGIIAPKDSNLDQMAAALSLYLSLVSSGRAVNIATPENPLVEVSSLVGIDKVKTTLGGSIGDLVVSFPYKEGEIEKVSYTLEDGFLNIVVKAGELGFSFDQKDVKYVRPQGTTDLLFIIGAPRLSDLGKLFDPELLKDTTVVNVDNSSENQGFGDLVMVSTKLSSVSEQIANVLLSMNLPMDADISQNLLDGILSATNNFQNPNTSALAFEMSGVLMRNGARRKSEVRERATTAFSRPQTIQNQTSTPVRQAAGSATSVASAPVQNSVQNTNELSSTPANQDQTLNNPPEDWLTPKIYKGSTNF